MIMVMEESYRKVVKIENLTAIMDRVISHEILSIFSFNLIDFSRYENE